MHSSAITNVQAKAYYLEGIQLKLPTSITPSFANAVHDMYPWSIHTSNLSHLMLYHCSSQHVSLINSHSNPITSCFTMAVHNMKPWSRISPTQTLGHFVAKGSFQYPSDLCEKPPTTLTLIKWPPGMKRPLVYCSWAEASEYYTD